MAPTALSAQLRNLRDLGHKAVATKKYKPSLLFDPKIVDDLDRETLLEIGLEGLEGLEVLDGRFGKFRDTLFSPKAKGVDRYLITKDQEDLIKREIKDFLCLLSPVALCPESLKALEWLMRRFMIATFDFEEVLGCVIPYHDSDIFVQVVQNLVAPNQSRFLPFLRVKKTKLPLPRDSIVKFIANDFSLLEFLFSLAEDSRRNGVYNLALNSMIGMIVVQYTESISSLSENHVRSMISNLSMWQKKPDTLADLDLLHTSFMSLAALSKKVSMDHKVILDLVTIALLSISDQTIDSTLEYLAVIIPPSEDYLRLPESCLKLILDSDVRNRLARRCVETSDYSLAIFVIKAILLHISEHPLTYKKFKKNTLRLISAIGPENLLSVNIAELAASITNENNSEALLDLISHVSSSVSTTQSNIDSSTAAPAPNYMHSGPDMGKPSPQNYALLLKSGNKHILEELLNNKPLILKLIPPKDLLPILSDIVFSEFNQDLICQYYDLLLDLPHESVDINRLAEVVAGKFWPTGPGNALYQVSASISATNRSKGLQRIFGALKTAKSVLSSSKDDISPQYLSSCALDVVDQIASNKSMVGLWISWLGSPYVFTRLFSLAVLSLCVDKIQLDISDMGKIATSLMLNPPKENPSITSFSEKGPYDFFIKVCESNDTDIDSLLSILRTLLAKTLLCRLPRLKHDDDGIRSYLSDTVTDPERLCILNSFKIAITIIAPGFLSLKDSIDSLSEILCGFSLEFFISFYIETFETKSIDRCYVLELCIAQIQKIISANNEHDYQLVVPLIMSALTVDNWSLRLAAINALEVVLDTYATLRIKSKIHDASTIYAYDKLYGNCKNKVFYATYNASHHIAKQLIERKKQLLSSPLSLSNVLHESFSLSGKMWKQEVIPFLCSVSLYIPSYAIKLALLKSLRNVNSSKKVKLLLSYIPNIIGNYSNSTLPTSPEPLVTKYTALVRDTIECILSTLHTCPSSKVLNSRDGKYINIFAEALLTPPITLVNSQPPLDIQLIALNALTPQLFSQLNSSNKVLLFNTLIDISSSVKGHSPEAIFNTKIVLKNLELDEHIVSSFIADLISKLSYLSGTNKRMKKDTAVDDATMAQHCEHLGAFNKVISFLELILLKKDVICGKLELASPLSELLNIVVNTKQDVTISLEYLNQLLLSTLFHVIKGAKRYNLKSGADLGIRVDCVVNCIRETENLQTQNSALLLLSAIAEVCPEEVLLNIMPVFIFIGTNIISKDDNYNFYVIHKTLETLLPALVSNNNANNNADSASMSKVSTCIKVFAGALPHIPRHRRLRLFNTLVQTLGQDKYLSLVIMHLIRLSVISKSQSQDEVLEFSKSLLLLFPLRPCLTAVIDIVRIAEKIPDEVSSYVELSSLLSLEIAHVLFSGSIKRLTKIRLNLSEFVLSALSSTEFADKFLDIDAGADAYIELQVDLIRTIIDAKYKFSFNALNKPLAKCLSHSLNKITSLQTLQSFSGSMGVLLHGDSLSSIASTEEGSHPQHLVLINNGVNAKDVDIIQNRYISFVSLISSKLPQYFEGRPINAGDAVLIRELVLKALELGVASTRLSSENCLSAVFNMISTLARIDSTATVNLLSGVAIKLIDSKNWALSDRLFAEGITCISNLYIRVCDDCITSLPSAMETVSDRIGKSNITPVSTQVLNFYSTVLRAVPEFITPYVKCIIEFNFDVINISNTRTEDSSRLVGAKKQAKLLMDEILKSVRLPLVLESVCTLFQRVVSMDSATFTEYAGYITDIITTAKRSKTLLEYYYDVFRILLVCSDYRRVCISKFSPDEIRKVEAAIISAFVTLFEALDDSKISFLFTNTFEWAIPRHGVSELNDNPIGLEHRTAFLYCVASALLTELGNRFEACALKLIEHINSVIIKDAYPEMHRENVSSGSSMHVRSSKDIQPIEAEQQLESSFSCMISFIQVFFKSPSGANVARDTLLSITESLSSMIKLGMHIHNSLCTLYPALTNHNLVSDYMKIILAHTKDEDADIRHASVLLLTDIFATLKISMASYIPESISYISELLDDSDYRVEKSSRNLLKTIEESTNCSLEHYF